MNKSAQSVVRVLCLTLLGAALAVPLIWMVSGSLQSNSALSVNPYQWIPDEPKVSNYPHAFNSVNFGGSMANSFIVALVIATVGVFLSQMAGYVLAKFRFRGRNIIFWSIVSTLMIPFPAIMVPVFIEARSLGMLDSLTGLIVPGLMTAFTVFFMRQYMLGLPDEYLESARIDGASEWQIYLRVVVPLSWPVVGSMGMLTFVASWNNLLWPLLVIQSVNNYTIPIAMTQFQGLYVADSVGALAMSTLATIPVVILFLVFRKRILSSVMVSGGIK